MIDGHLDQSSPRSDLLQLPVEPAAVLTHQRRVQWAARRIPFLGQETMITRAFIILFAAVGPLASPLAQLGYATLHDLALVTLLPSVGVLALGPSIWSDLAGFAYHFWNGAAFGTIFLAVSGGRSIRRGCASAIRGSFMRATTDVDRGYRIATCRSSQ